MMCYYLNVHFQGQRVNTLLSHSHFVVPSGYSTVSPTTLQQDRQCVLCARDGPTVIVSAFAIPYFPLQTFSFVFTKQITDNCFRFYHYTGFFISPSGISELYCAKTKKDTAERSISIGREYLQVFFFVLGALAYFQVPPLGGSREEKCRSQ